MSRLPKGRNLCVGTSQLLGARACCVAVVHREQSTPNPCPSSAKGGIASRHRPAHAPDARRRGPRGRECWNVRAHASQLGSGYLSSLTLTEIATPHLEALSARVGDSSSVAVLDGTDIVTVRTLCTSPACEYAGS
jgi:hypothetical protein